jgi:hypothetical protein
VRENPVEAVLARSMEHLRDRFTLEILFEVSQLHIATHINGMRSRQRCDTVRRAAGRLVPRAAARAITMYLAK